MKFNQLIINLLLTQIIGFSLPLWGQTLKAYEKAADEALEKEEYYNAVYYYELVLRSKPKPGVYYKYAEACRQSFAYRKAEEAYQKISEHKDRERYDKLDFYYGLTLKHNGKYDEAEAAYRRFLSTPQAEGYYRQKAEQELKSCALAKELSQKPSDSIKIERLGDNINTEYSDFGAHEVGEEGQLYYSSLRFDRKKGEEEKKIDAKRFIAKLLVAKDLSSEGKALPGINLDEIHNSNSCLSPDGQRLYFTRCNGQRSDSIICEIYMSRLQKNGNWSRPYKLPAPLNLPGSTNTQPQIAVEEGQEWIYFSSDRGGGQGAMDIWRARLLNDSLSDNPQNLGKSINSIENELTPYYHAPSRSLYFSSQWHLGMGGYDVFRSQYLPESDSWEEPVNMGVPVNSAANDLYWVFNSNDSSGYFASNRAGSMSITEESCCNDIYKFQFNNKITSLPPPIDTPTVAIIDPPTTDSNLIVSHIPPDNKGGGDGSSYEEKIDELNKMLPLRLYFHNDEPDSNVTVGYTDKPYQLPFEHYVTLQEEYVREHAGQFAPERRMIVSDKINNFFEQEVRGEYSRMNIFFDAVLQLLETGIPLEVQIKGYTSPRSYEGYNIQLAKRRIMSVRKQFFIHRQGAFIPYFQKGMLIVTELPLGESTSPPGISDAFDDPKNSIYSVEASQERRAEIVILQKK